MHNEPSLTEMLEAVRNYVATVAVPNLSGHAAFHGKVAVNLLDTAMREVALRTDAEARERMRLQALTASEDMHIETLRRALAATIRSGGIDQTSTELMSHLRATTEDQLAIDQPHYSGLRNTQDTA